MSYNLFQNSSSKKLVITQVIFVLIIAGGLLVFDKFFNQKDVPAGEGTDNKATLLVDFEDTQRMFTGEVVEGMTILDALNASVAAGRTALVYTVDSSNNVTVTKINDHTAVKDKNFSFYLNDEKIATEDINRTGVRVGDKIIIRLE